MLIAQSKGRPFPGGNKGAMGKEDLDQQMNGKIDAPQAMPPEEIAEGGMPDDESAEVWRTGEIGRDPGMTLTPPPGVVYGQDPGMNVMPDLPPGTMLGRDPGMNVMPDLTRIRRRIR
jgi:hypothetical protein